MASTINALTSGGGLAVSGDTSGSLQLQTNNGTTAMTIDTSQNVGIGTSSPAEKLDVNGNLKLRGAGIALFNNSDNSNYYYIQNSGATGSGNPFLAFTQGGVGERMRIDSSGNLLVGQTSKNANAIGAYIAGTGDSQTGQVSSCLASSTSANASYTLYSTGASAYRFYVTMDGKINCTSTTIAGISDQRLKENVRTLDAGLNEILELKPRRFDWKEGKGKNIKNDLGFIAQEFETVFPEMIGRWIDETPEGEEPYKSISPDLIPVLVKAIQEQQAIITDLKARIETLEGAK